MLLTDESLVGLSLHSWCVVMNVYGCSDLTLTNLILKQ